MGPNIIEGYTSKSGHYYDKVREVAFKKGELLGNLGTLVTETADKSKFYSADSFAVDNGVLIYQSKHNPLIAYRIYKDYADCYYYDYNDYKFIQKLQDVQSNVLLTKFPTGVVTLDGNVIGQEIPYFSSCVSLDNFFEKYVNKNYIKIYRTILDILKEMYDNGVLYLDIHSGNFIMNPNDYKFKINVNDFDEKYLSFDPTNKYTLGILLENYRLLIESLNKIIGIDNKVPKLLKSDQFNDFYEQINDMEKRLIKTR